MNNVSKEKAIEILRYRFNAIQVGLLVLEKQSHWFENESKVCIFVGGKLDTEATITTLTNSAIEAAIIHSRVLLDFLGLKVNKNRLVQAHRNKNHSDDLFIEHEVFGSLKVVTPEEAVNTYHGPLEEALAYIIHLANKGLAHSTINFEANNDDFRLLDIAFRGVVKLMENRFYIPLGLETPVSPVSEVRIGRKG